MNKPTEEQIQEVLAGTSTPETARLVAQWFATDEGTAYLSRSMDCEVEQVKLGYEELYVNHEIASDERACHSCTGNFVRCQCLSG